MKKKTLKNKLNKLIMKAENEKNKLDIYNCVCLLTEIEQIKL